MAQQAANQYMRQVLHHTDPPPPVEARFFYAAGGILIDDPLSPLPPPIATGAAGSRLPPKPFSEYDSTALDKAWHALRKKLLKYTEERGEKESTELGGQDRTGSQKRQEGKRVSQSDSRPSTPIRKPGRLAATSLSQYDGSSDQESGTEAFDGPSSFGVETSTAPTVTGTPFIRAPLRRKLQVSSADERRAGRDRAARPKPHTHDTYEWDDVSHLVEHSPVPMPRKSGSGPTDKVAVGISRLHQVEMPNLKMVPIYWEPVNDIAPVVRGTWFYQDTMLPVETHVANMLEAGYVELQVWSETWKDELNSAVEVGAFGEMKLVHMLWPVKRTFAPKAPGSMRGDSGSRPGTANRESLLQTVVATTLAEHGPETPEERRSLAAETACDLIDVASGINGPDSKASGSSIWGRQGTIRSYADHGVIYANNREARILKSSLLPSAYYGRRPIANYIRKGHKLGIAVVRGFDQKAWDKLHPTKEMDERAKKAERGTSTSASGVSAAQRRKTDPDIAAAERPKVTDLIFVIHGIGQKLSQRMESFHFTHAINAFRREVNVEVGSKECKGRFRKDMGGIMVLPINWRNALSFEEGGYRDGDEDPAHNEFTLTDITPDTLPSVRGIVSDVMLDIPYYMSHHQPKMIAAVIREANRVYKLWCLNNPGFSQHGRVHTIAHSLGSVIAVDILSKQPTRVPAHLEDPTKVDLDKENLDHYLFNTHNLILAGSPAGFFLLLRRAQLMPRIDSSSAAAMEDPTALTEAVCGRQGQYGCIAVENVYNMINGYDPVAYRMNAAVDAGYAASLKKGWVPSATNGWFSIFGSSSSRKTLSTAPPLPRLPSNVELETHNFSREEIAEKRMLLLNDNAQIDFWVRYGGGALEIQYLTMLSAHSSYWYIRDFVRFLVVETGRESGTKGTLEGMRAVKAKTALA
jgi:pimeloyl-ACP methyl ester carboxylesterase